jgi:hypothetical protein
LRYLFRAFIFVSLLPSLINAQSLDFKKHKSLDIAVTSGGSVGGFYFAPSIGFFQNRHHVRLGAKVSISEASSLSNMPMGILSGYRYYFRNNPLKRVQFYFDVQYQLLMSRSFSRTADRYPKNYLHEIFATYGIEVRLWKKLFLGNELGVGYYFRSLFNTTSQERTLFGNYNATFQLYFSYRIDLRQKSGS